jgi:hypothetical protein
MATLSFDPAYTIPDPPPGPPACLTALASTAGSIGEKTSEASVKAEQVGRGAGWLEELGTWRRALLGPLRPGNACRLRRGRGQTRQTPSPPTPQVARVAYDKAGQVRGAVNALLRQGRVAKFAAGFLDTPGSTACLKRQVFPASHVRANLTRPRLCPLPQRPRRHG